MRAYHPNNRILQCHNFTEHIFHNTTTTEHICTCITDFLHVSCYCPFFPSVYISTEIMAYVKSGHSLSHDLFTINLFPSLSFWVKFWKSKCMTWAMTERGCPSYVSVAKSLTMNWSKIHRPQGDSMREIKRYEFPFACIRCKNNIMPSGLSSNTAEGISSLPLCNMQQIAEIYIFQ